MRSWHLGLRALVGILVGVVGGLLTTLLGIFTDQLVPFVSLLVLLVAVVGLTVGAGAAAYTYAASGLVIIVFTLLPHESRSIDAA
ncbi:MAG TPA: hypothetical protein VFK93_00005, partial [Candidatus Limnocylindria bacterium]|nr:hypothetical protein [Candidatus Limnocylindria bacterium]